MRWLGIAIALAVAMPPADADSPSQLEWLLDTRFTGTKVRLRGNAELRWRPDSAKPIADVSLDDDSAFRRLRAKAGQTRIAFGGSRVELAAYVKAEHLAPVASRRAVVRLAAAAADRPFTDRTPGIHLEAGALVEPKRRGKRATRVAIKRGVIEASGYLPNAIVATEFVASASPKEREGPSRNVKSPAVLRVRPGGAVVARLVESHPIAVTLIETRGKHALVACEEGDTVAVGLDTHGEPRARRRERVGRAHGFWRRRESGSPLARNRAVGRSRRRADRPAHQGAHRHLVPNPRQLARGPKFPPRSGG